MTFVALLRLAMVEKRHALGRGLSALIPSAAPPPPPPIRERETPRVPAELDIDLLSTESESAARAHGRRATRRARTVYSHARRHSAVLVRKLDDRIEIVAGERRWRAAQRAGLLKVPVVYREIPDDKMLEVALIENIQRERSESD
jgi:ParB family chromosome partitioning protein